MSSIYMPTGNELTDLFTDLNRLASGLFGSATVSAWRSNCVPFA